MPSKRKKADKLHDGGQGAVASSSPTPPESPSSEAGQGGTQNTPRHEEICDQIGQALDRVRQSDLLEDVGHLRADMRMMRALARNPIYIPSPFFNESASQLIALSRQPGADPRVIVGAIKTVAEMVKLNLKTNELAAKANDAGGAGADGTAVHVKVIVNMPEERPQPKVVENIAPLESV